MKITIECEPKEIAALVNPKQQQPITVQTCPQCSQVHLPADVCPYCGFDYTDLISIPVKKENKKNTDTISGENNIGACILKSIRLMEAARSRGLSILGSIPLEECPRVQSALARLDCSLQTLRQEYESWLHDQPQP